MITRVLIIGLCITLCMIEVSTELRVKEVQLLITDPEYINRSLTQMSVFTALNTVSLEIYLHKEFPRTVTFHMKLIEIPPGNVLIDLANYTTFICNQMDSTRLFLPNFLRRLTQEGKCGGSGQFKFRDAGLYKFATQQFVYRPYPIISTNELMLDQRIIFKYDVILLEEDNEYQANVNAAKRLKTSHP